MTTLWRQRDFGRFWLAQTISGGVSSQITFIALPLTAALMLDASPA